MNFGIRPADLIDPDDRPPRPDRRVDGGPVTASGASATPVGTVAPPPATPLGHEPELAELTTRR